MVASSLQDDLLRIPGVEGAEVDGSQDAPAGLRIRIAEGADQEAVGEAIRQVLRTHGLGTDTQLPGEQTSETAPEPVVAAEREASSVAVMTSGEVDSPVSAHLEDLEVGAVIDLTDRPSAIPAADEQGTDEHASPAISQVSQAAEPAEPASSQAGSPEEPEEPEESNIVPPFVEPRPSVVSEELSDAQDEDDQPSPIPSRDSVARFDSVAVVEGRSGIIVTVTASNGAEMSHVASSSEGGVEAAVVKAAASLVDPTSPDPLVVEIEDRRVEGVDIVMIVLDMDGELFAGSAVVGAGRAFALGRAAWAALAL